MHYGNSPWVPLNIAFLFSRVFIVIPSVPPCPSTASPVPTPPTLDLGFDPQQEQQNQITGCGCLSWAQTVFQSHTTFLFCRRLISFGLLGSQEAVWVLAKCESISGSWCLLKNGGQNAVKGRSLQSSWISRAKPLLLWDWMEAHPLLVSYCSGLYYNRRTRFSPKGWCVYTLHIFLGNPAQNIGRYNLKRVGE